MASNSAGRLTGLAAAMVLATLIPTMAFAAPKPTGQSTSQISNQNTNTSGAGSSVIDQLNLTPKQKQQIKAIQTERQRQIDAELTKEQRAKLAQALKSGQKLSPALQSLNLSKEKNAKVQSIFQTSRKQINDILTPQQRQKLKDLMNKQPQGSGQNIEP